MKENLDILFLGGLFPKEKESEIIKKSIDYIQNAANALQWNLIEGIDSNLNHPVCIVNTLYIGSYPKHYKDILIKTYSFSHTTQAKDINVGFINIAGIKVFSRGLCILPFLKKWAKKSHKKKVIIAYGMTNIFVQAMSIVKKINPNIVNCLVIPDLPQYMNTGVHPSLIYSIIKKYDTKFLFQNLSKIDCYVLLTKHMKDFLPPKKYVVVEGVASNVYTGLGKITKREKTIAYTGSLNIRYGVLDLVEAFNEIEDLDCRLILCGSGDAEEQIRIAQNADPRIQFCGLVTREEALKLQMEATVLVNPRKNLDEFTKYSFPSKNLEYLSSGTPMIAYRLDGIPEEYESYTYYVKDNTVESLKNALISVLSMSPQERENFGSRAKKFVLNEKNNILQARKIIGMLQKLM